MQLVTSSIVAQTQKTGNETNIAVPAGQRVIIETSPGGAEVLDVTVPVGKRWEVSFGVDIREFDA